MSTFIYFILLFPYILLGQETIHISYGEKLNLNIGRDQYKFNFNENGKPIVLDHNSMPNFIFNNPGSYKIQVTNVYDNGHNHTNSCEHHSLPAEIQVIVDDVKINFDRESIKLSAPIHQNQPTNHIELWIDIMIESLDGKEINMNMSTVKSAGIGTEIIATLDPSHAKLSLGKHRLKYHLSGICTQPSYIQFDFIHHNGNFEPIALLNPVIK